MQQLKHSILVKAIYCVYEGMQSYIFIRMIRYYYFNKEHYEGIALDIELCKGLKSVSHCFLFRKSNYFHGHMQICRLDMAYAPETVY